MRTLAGILRVAIGLDRSHEGRVRGVQAEIQAKRVVVLIDAAPDADISLELYAANERKRCWKPSSTAASSCSRPDARLPAADIPVAAVRARRVPSSSRRRRSDRRRRRPVVGGGVVGGRVGGVVVVEGGAVVVVV